ncbi:MAG: nucleoside triphosphate pyrophosphohydrolase [Ilumatobacter sp.]|nr:MAG: nucleoside triphosphate pyrophosphohydrolase [Ilumatobacter sp.]
MSDAPRVTVVGLGPGGRDHVTVETLDAVAAHTVRFLRTSVHPTADLVPDAVTFDHLYESADSFEQVYAQITDALVAAATDHGEVLYAVPGSPLVLERTVRRLRDDPRVETDVRPAMSFLDVAWARLGVDPVEIGVRLVDGHEFATAAAGDSGPLLIAHVHADWVLSDIKLAVDDLDDDHVIDRAAHTPVVVLQRLGTPDELITHTTWAELDRTVAADHLTSLYVPHLAAPVGRAYVAFHQLARTLREQCPWDIEQTHASLMPHLIEETYEVVDAVAGLDPDDATTDEHLIEELGDLLYQVEFHATIAEQEGRFTIADVATGIHDKLVRRHPHVFGDVTIDATGDGSSRLATTEVLANWDDIKRAEKGRTSVFDGVPGALPGLAYARKVQSKAAKVGFDWPTVEGALPKIAEEADEVRAAVADGDPDAVAAELGDLLFSVVNVARHLDVDPEVALRAATNTFRARFEIVERLATERGIDLHARDTGRAEHLATLDALWDEAKRTS